MRPDEMRIIIRTSEGGGDTPRPIPADIFQRAFTTILDLLKAADAELHPKRKFKSEFFVSHLAMGSNEFGVFEQRRSAALALNPSIELAHRCITSVYQSNYAQVAQMDRLPQKLIQVGRAIVPGYKWDALFPSESILLDQFFARQTERLVTPSSVKIGQPSHFIGSAITSFDGTLGSLDYRGATWQGRLVLSGSKAEIDCVLDRSKGEDIYNKFGNKRVSVTGRAIYTGEKALPERMDVKEIKAVPTPDSHIDIRGALAGKRYFVGWNRENPTIQ